MDIRFNSLEICAGAGGQALGLERAGFDPIMLIENDTHTCNTLRANRPGWNVLQADLRLFVGAEHPEVLDVDLLSGGVPCTPFSVAGRQQGSADQRDLLEAAIWLTSEVQPRALLIENVPTLLTDARFARSRAFVTEMLEHLGYRHEWRILLSEGFGVPQRRPHSVLVAMRPAEFERYVWPEPHGSPQSVGEVLRDSMASRGWEGADEWAAHADEIAPTIVGGSKNHGGADLGPTRTKNQWARLGVNGGSLADEAPGPDFVMEYGRGKHGRDGLPKLTVDQVALLQGFQGEWIFTGGKTARYRQVAQTLPPPLGEAVGRQIAAALGG